MQQDINKRREINLISIYLEDAETVTKTKRKRLNPEEHSRDEKVNIESNTSLIPTCAEDMSSRCEYL